MAAKQYSETIHDYAVVALCDNPEHNTQIYTGTREMCVRRAEELRRPGNTEIVDLAGAGAGVYGCAVRPRKGYRELWT